MKKKAQRILIALADDTSTRRDISSTPGCARSVKKALSTLGFIPELFPIRKQDMRNCTHLLKKIFNSKAACIFNLFEGFSNDAFAEKEFVSFLEEIPIPFTGNSSRTLRMCLDKAYIQNIFSTHNIPSPKGIFVRSLQDIDQCPLTPPLFIKPAREDASLGIDRESLVLNEEKLKTVIKKKLRQFPSGLIMEEFKNGPEYNVGVLGFYPYRIIGISVIDYTQYRQSNPFLTFDSKWNPATSEYKKVQPQIMTSCDKKFLHTIKDIIKRIGALLGCRGYFRIDMRQEDNALFVLDVNPNPDINHGSGFILQAAHKGYSYNEVIRQIVMYSFDRRNNLLIL